MQGPTSCRPANAEAIAEFAEETEAEALRGALRYTSDHEALIIVALWAGLTRLRKAVGLLPHGQAGDLLG